ncbi:DUF1254 domain-containing protein [Algoriphagus sp. oki45]|uniref:DUF1254 domain-containing protein n=1 Tax=Algoriphagus sp. oki45 TaxID=3067294 RepID=UPI0027FF2B8E|nr:DUF1254 domain-containing protein [Algoriphagus sp. oki45]
MKLIRELSLLFLIVFISCNQEVKIDTKIPLSDAQLVGNEIIETDFGDIQLNETYITKSSIQTLNDQLALQRAIEVYQWSLPITTFGMWYKAHFDVYEADDLDFVEYESFNEKVGIVTSNSSTPYIVTWLDLSRTGPVVIDYPAGPSAGSIMNFFQLSIADLGFTGPDKGKGGKYLIIPPKYDASILDIKGVYVINASTNKLFIGTRFLSPDQELNDQMKAQFLVGKYGEELRPARFITKTDKRFRGHPFRGLKYFELVHEVIQNEPVAEEDKIFNTYMKYLGIEDGKPFNPNDTQKQLFTEAANLGELMCRANQIMPRQNKPFYKGSRWYRLLSNFPVTKTTPDIYFLDESNEYLYEAVTITRGMQSNEPGPGTTSYLTTKEDAMGNFLSGSKTYKLHLPAGIPASNFWSLVLYSEDTRCFIDNKDAKDKLRATSIDSRDKNLVVNSDGSVDLYIGPKSPEGKESNWLQTIPGEGWFPLFRTYGTQQAFFDKTWKIGQFEVVE